MPALRLGTRSSALARRQTEFVAQALTAQVATAAGNDSDASQRSTVDLQTVVISTTGDRDQQSSLLTIGGQGVFVRQLEDALREGRIDVAVHSAKDIPSELLPGTTIAATLPRADVRDALVGGTLAGLPAGARVGTGSRRRVAQLRAARPDLEPADIRGNVGTRLRKLADGDYDAVILAAAGLQRLDQAHAVTELLSIDVMLPSPGQGVIALQIREHDEAARAALAPIDDAPTSTALRAERALLGMLGAGCALPIGGLAHVRAGEVVLVARVLDMRGERVIRAQESGPSDDPEAVGRRVAESLLARGARDLLQEVAS